MLCSTVTPKFPITQVWQSVWLLYCLKVETAKGGKNPARIWMTLRLKLVVSAYQKSSEFKDSDDCRMCISKEKNYLMLCTLRPMPPAHLEIIAHLVSVSKIPWMESSVMVRRKQLESWGLGVAALNSVGEAWVKSLCDNMSYVSMAESMSSPWIPMATRISICWGLSTGLPSIFNR